MLTNNCLQKGTSKESLVQELTWLRRFLMRCCASKKKTYYAVRNHPGRANYFSPGAVNGSVRPLHQFGHGLKAVLMHFNTACLRSTNFLLSYGPNLHLGE